MSTIVRQLTAIVTAQTAQYDAAMARVETRAAATAAKIRMAGMVMGGIFAVVGVASIKMAADFERSMANVNTLLGGNSKRIKELGEDVKRMARETGKGLDDLTGGLYQVISAFGDSADSVKILDITAKAAVAGLATTTEALNLISAVTKGYGDTSAVAAQKAADLAFETVRLGQTTFPELAASIGRVIPLAAKMGVTVEEVNAIFATLTGVTGNAAEVSTQAAGMLRAFIKPTEAMKLAIEDLGYSGSEALLGSLGLVPAMKALVATTDGSVEATGKLFRRTEAMTGLFALTGGQADVFAMKLEAMADASGSATKAFDIQADTFHHRLDKLLQEISTGMVDLGTSLMPMAEKIMEWAGGIAALAKEIGNLFAKVAGATLPKDFLTISLKGLEAIIVGAGIAVKNYVQELGNIPKMQEGMSDDWLKYIGSIDAADMALKTMADHWLGRLSEVSGTAEEKLEQTIKLYEQILARAASEKGTKFYILFNRLTDVALRQVVALTAAKKEAADADARALKVLEIQRVVAAMDERERVKIVADQIRDGEKIYGFTEDIIKLTDEQVAAVRRWAEQMSAVRKYYETLVPIPFELPGMGLLRFFQEELPEAFVTGWNQYVVPAIKKTDKEIADEFSLHMARGLTSAFSAAFSGEFAFDNFLTQFGRGLKNMFTWIIEDWSQRLAKRIGGVKGELAAMAYVFGGQLLMAIGQEGGVMGLLASTSAGALAGGIAAGPWGALAGGLSGFISGLFGMGGGETDLGLPTFAEAQAILAQRAQEAADALERVTATIKDTNYSIYRTKEGLDNLRDSLQAAREAERDAARTIRRTGTKFMIIRGERDLEAGADYGVEEEISLTGGPALKHLQRLIDEAIGTGRYGRISRREKKEILAQVVGEENEQLAAILIEAAATVASIDATFAVQKDQLAVLRRTRKIALKTREDLTSIEDAIEGGSKDIVDAIYWLGDLIPTKQGGGDISSTGLYQLHAGERVLNARDTAQMDRGEFNISRGAGPTVINLVVDGRVLATAIMPGIEDKVHGRQSRLFSDTIRRRGVK